MEKLVRINCAGQSDESTESMEEETIGPSLISSVHKSQVSKPQTTLFLESRE